MSGPVLIAVTALALSVGAICAVLILVIIRLVRRKLEIQRRLIEDVIARRLIEGADVGDYSPQRLRRTDQPILLAQVLGRALELVEGETGLRMVRIARHLGCLAGLNALSKSKRTIDRISAARTLRYFPEEDVILQGLAMSDSNMRVRVEALLSLAALGRAPPTRCWSQWVKIGANHPHSSVAALLKHPQLISCAGLRHAASSNTAPLSVRLWALEGLVERIDGDGDSLAMKIAINEGQPLKLRKAGIQLLRDPLLLAQYMPSLIDTGEWALLVEICNASARTHSSILIPKLVGLLSHADWRVQTAAAKALDELSQQPQSPALPMEELKEEIQPLRYSAQGNSAR